MAKNAYYTFYITDEGDAAIGLSPIVTDLFGVTVSQTNYVTSSNPMVLPVTEIGGGFYSIEVDWDTFDPSGISDGETIFLAKIDAGLSIVNTNERFLSVRLEREDVDYIDAHISRNNIIAGVAAADAAASAASAKADAILGFVSPIEASFTSAEDMIKESMEVLFKQSAELYLDLKEDSSWVRAGVQRLVDIQQGEWDISGNQLRLLDQNGSNLVTFNLRDLNNNPTMGGAYRRYPAAGGVAAIVPDPATSDYSSALSILGYNIP